MFDANNSFMQHWRSENAKSPGTGRILRRGFNTFGVVAALHGALAASYAGISYAIDHRPDEGLMVHSANVISKGLFIGTALALHYIPVALAYYKVVKPTVINPPVAALKTVFAKSSGSGQKTGAEPTSTTTRNDPNTPGFR